jgi:hypothetical protein
MSGKHWASPLFEPFKDYAATFNVFLDSTSFRRGFDDGSINFTTACKASLAATAISLLLDKILDPKSDGLFGLPIIDEVVFVIFFLLANSIATVIFFPILKLFGGQNNFQSTVLAVIYSGIVFIPVGSLYGALENFTGRPVPPHATFGGQAWFMAMALSGLHDISKMRACIVIILSYLALVVITIILVIGGISIDKSLGLGIFS